VQYDDDGGGNMTCLAIAGDNDNDRTTHLASATTMYGNVIEDVVWQCRG